MANDSCVWQGWPSGFGVLVPILRAEIGLVMCGSALGGREKRSAHDVSRLIGVS
jgi:hypothetical protein